jgi:hypothetical protein
MEVVGMIVDFGVTDELLTIYSVNKLFIQVQGV